MERPWGAQRMEIHRWGVDKIPMLLTCLASSYKGDGVILRRGPVVTQVEEVLVQLGAPFVLWFVSSFQNCFNLVPYEASQGCAIKTPSKQLSLFNKEANGSLLHSSSVDTIWGKRSFSEICKLVANLAPLPRSSIRPRGRLFGTVDN